MTLYRPALRLVPGGQEKPVETTWFCGRCATPSPTSGPPAPAARVCHACGLGLMLETRADLAPARGDAFLVADSSLRVQAMSPAAERLLSVTEDLGVDHPVSELLTPADAEADSRASFASALASAIAGIEEPVSAHVRPWNIFGVRMRAVIVACGPPRGALVVLDGWMAPLRLIRN